MKVAYRKRFREFTLALSILTILTTNISWSMDEGIGKSVSLEHAQVIHHELGDGEERVSEEALITKIVDTILFPDVSRLKSLKSYANNFVYADKEDDIQYSIEKNGFYDKNDPETIHDFNRIYDEWKADHSIDESEREKEQGIGFSPYYKGNQNKEHVPSLRDLRPLLINKIQQIVAEEKRNHDKIAMYYGIPLVHGYWAEILTKVETKCQETSSCDLIKLFRYSEPVKTNEGDIENFRRQVFKGLLTALNPDPETCDESCRNRRQETAEILRSADMKNDQESMEFKGTILSLSPTIFGGYSRSNESAIGFWINGFEPTQERIDTTYIQGSLSRAPKDFLKSVNIVGKDQEAIMKAMIESYRELFPVHGTSGKEPRTGGVLFQFFVDPSIVNSAAYVAAPFGFKIAKEIERKGEIIAESRAILEALKTNMGGYITLNRDNKYTDPKTLNQLCPQGDGLDLSCTQIRLLPKYEWLQNPRLVRIKRYFMDNPSREWQEAFEEATNKIANMIIETRLRVK